MNLNNNIRRAGRIGVFCARHFLAVGVTVMAACVMWTVVYIALLIWAMMTDGGVGGPLAYPAGLLFVFSATLAASCILFFPCSALAEWFVRRRGLSIFAQIPFSMLLLALQCLAAVGIAMMIGSHPGFGDLFAGLGLLYLSLLVPLGLYWWVAQSLPLFLALIQRLRGMMRP
jgi:hypothetical protein